MSGDVETSQADQDLTALEGFLVGNQDLERLEALLDRFNILEALGVVRQELRHSDFLAFLLNPNDNHDLRDTFVKRLLQRVLIDAEATPVPVTPIELELWKLDRMEVLREWQHIDILLLDEEHKLAVIIENKIGSGEPPGQLQRHLEVVEQHYCGWRMIPVYLTPGGESPSHESYLPVDYGLVCEVVDGLSEGRASVVSPDLRTLLIHYTDMLRRNIVGDSDVARLCRQIYHQHKVALDLIYEHGPARWKEIHKLLKRLVAETPGLTFSWEGTEYPEDYIIFDVEEWDVPSLRIRDSEGSPSLAVYWVFHQYPEGVDLYLELADGNDPARQKLFDFAQRERALFQDVSEPLTQEEMMLFLRHLLTPEFYEKGTGEECDREIRRRWSEFLEQDLPRIDAAFKKERWIWESP